MISTGAAETPYVVGGLAILAASVRQHGKFSPSMFKGALAIGGLILLASFTNGTPYAQLARAFGILFALSAVALAVRSWTTPPKK